MRRVSDTNHFSLARFASRLRSTPAFHVQAAFHAGEKSDFSLSLLPSSFPFLLLQLSYRRFALAFHSHSSIAFPFPRKWMFRYSVSWILNLWRSFDWTSCGNRFCSWNLFRNFITRSVCGTGRKYFLDRDRQSPAMIRDRSD